MYIKENKNAMREINGLILMSFIFYIAYALMVFTIYSDKSWVMAFGTIATLVVVCTLISGIIAFFKYYNIIMLLVHRIHKGVFALQVLCMMFNWYIYNHFNNVDKMYKCIITIMFELIVILVTCYMYRVEAKMIKNIDARTEKALTEEYFKNESEEYTLKIKEAKSFLEEKIFRKLFVVFIGYFILSKHTVLVSIYVLVMHMLFGVKCNWIYEIIYGAKSKLYNVFSNVIPVVGLILYSMVSSDMISIPILEYIGAEIYIIHIYIPLLSFNMKIYTEARRLCK